MNMKRNENELEELLKDARMPTLLGQLPEDEPSLAWRSELNQKLTALQRAPKAPWWATWRPIAGLALAGALALTMFFGAPKPETVQSQAALDEVLIAAHRESVARQEIGAAPVSALQSDTGNQPALFDEVDVTTL